MVFFHQILVHHQRTIHQLIGVKCQTKILKSTKSQLTIKVRKNSKINLTYDSTYIKTKNIYV